MGNTYIKALNGYWILADANKLSYDSAKSTVVPYASLQAYMESKEIEFWYFYAPRKVCAVDTQLPDGVYCYTNDNIDTYLKAMDYFGIKYVDLRKNIHDADLNHYELFYKTDHHWKVETGLWAASEIIDELNARFGYSLQNVCDIDNYYLETYPKAEFGSIGRGVTHFVADSEDFSVPYPIFETSYRLEVPSKGMLKIMVLDLAL